MTVENDGLIIIGENINATRKLKASSPRIVIDGNSAAIRYTLANGDAGAMDITEIFPWDEALRRKTPAPTSSTSASMKSPSIPKSATNGCAGYCRKSRR